MQVRLSKAHYVMSRLGKFSLWKTRCTHAIVIRKTAGGNQEPENAVAGEGESFLGVGATVHFFCTLPSAEVSTLPGQWGRPSFPGLWATCTSTSGFRGFSSINHVPLGLSLPAGTH